ncbi:hypothetical protein AMJ49_06685 [Parcubacteria bacterium DG_74_2]|nr:MAG: hypothetical protein AMJ49_06685 [Parcubacteria bacterium DG_74_2]
MTLILTALCKNGICVCADTRYQLKNDSRLVENKDGNHKIYKFDSDDISLIIFNHGINNINGKGWKTFCSDYTKSYQWKNKKLDQVAEGFKLFIENDIQKELQRNKIDHTIGFVLCGKTIYDNDFDVYELWWDPDYSFIHLENEAIIKTGNGKTCLDDYFKNNSELNTKEFWKSKNTSEAQKELEKLFKVAVKERNRLNRNDFSDDYNTECIK